MNTRIRTIWPRLFYILAFTITTNSGSFNDFDDSGKTAIETEHSALINALQKKYLRLPWGIYKSISPSQGKLFNLEQGFDDSKYYSMKSWLDCTACKLGVDLVQTLITLGLSEDKLIKMIDDDCVFFKIKSPGVCKGVTKVFRPPVQELKAPAKNVTTFKVLHLSDTHYDPYYAEGANAECDDPLCCRASSGPVKNASAAAGRWGDYRKCDTPKRTIDHMLKHIADTHPDIKYILWTGDLPPHDIWNQTKRGNLKILKDTVAQMTEMFPGVPIFPAVGNHESVPVNSFPTPNISPPNSTISWLYDELDAQWRRWLPAEASKTVRRGAFYSVLVHPGFRIISLNMNYCNNMNWWLMLNSTDPVSQLQWLIHELQSAELSGEKVHIIGHIPPGNSDCLEVWSRNYYAIVNRYESTITAQFFGHTHYDEFEVFYDPKDLKRATSIAYVGPSVTPYYNLNPGYRIYYVDGDHNHTTRLVVDHETWTINLDEANEAGHHPIWYKLYSARDAYSMDTLRPQDWDKFIGDMSSNDNVFQLYYEHYWKNSPRRSICDADCRKELVCDARSGRSHDRRTLCGRMAPHTANTPPHLSHWFNL